MPIARRDSGDSRVIAHLDLDCFYVQVEQRRRPELRGKPVAVVQYNPWKGGGLIAVSYEARRCGVLRSMRGDDAKKVCPDIELLRAPWADGNAPSNWYRDAGTEVVTVLSRGGVCERASIDEVYLDITEAAAARLLKDFPFSLDSLSEEARNSHILGIDEQDDGNAMTTGDWLCQKDSPRCDALLACGAVIVAELRAAVLAETQFTCSAGIAHNKMLAKLTSSMHKPAQQTVIPASYVPTLLASLPLKKIQRLGGKLGKAVQEDLGVKTPGDLLPFSQLKLQELYGVNTGTWLWNMARGKNGDEVQGRVLTKSHSCSRAFPGPKALTSMTSVMHWLGELTDRLQEQLDLDLELHNRKARLLVFHATVELRGGSSNQPAKKFPSKSCPLRYGKEKILADCRSLFERGLRDFCPLNQSISPSKKSGSKSGNWAVTLISIGAGDISAVPTGVNPISSFFTAPAARSNLQATNSTSESGTPGEHQGAEISRSPSWNSLDDLMYDEASGSLKPCCSLGDDANSSDADVQCTPAFGSINSPVRQKSQFHLHENDDQDSVQAGSILSTTRAEDVEPTLIQCSPVEHPELRIEHPEAGIEHPEAGIEHPEAGIEHPELRKDHSEVKMEHPRVKMEHSEVGMEHPALRIEHSEVGMEHPELRIEHPELRMEHSEVGMEHSELRMEHPECRMEHSEVKMEHPGVKMEHSEVRIEHSEGRMLPFSQGSGSKSSLKDLWQRNAKKRSASNRWENYKQEEIDEEVLAQLPVEIQMELRNSLKLNNPPQPPPQQRPSKQQRGPNIRNFFPSSK